MILTIAMSLVLGSCNNESGSKESTTDQSQGKKEGESAQTAKAQNEKGNTGAQAFLGSGKFAYLAIDRDSLEKFFVLTPPQGGLKAKKIVFRFGHDGSATSSVVIDGFLTKSANVNYLDRPPVYLLPAFQNSSADLSGKKIYLSDLEMTSAQYDRLKAGSKKYLIFIPFIKGGTAKEQNYVSYNLFWLDSIGVAVTLPETFGEDNELNPSPPADPGQ
jgi:hypothetical protein